VSATSVIAQPAGTSAFWVVEGNVKRPDYTIIRFYDDQLKLIKEERIDGKFLDIRKKQNQRHLNRKLEEYLKPLQAKVIRRRVKDSIP
jgi:hypothetical protein